MQIFRDVRDAHLPGPTFLTIGNFDGLHRGHQVLLARLRANAANAGGQSALLTFDPHPLAVLRPDTPLHLLTTPLERLTLAGNLGVDVGIVQPFTRELAQLEPSAFLQLLHTHLGLAGLTVGPDFALGRDRSGTLDVLTELGRQMGFGVDVVEPVAVAGEEVRSYTIRQALREGQVERVASLLGREYTVSGQVAHGDHRGRTINVPTANLQVDENRLLPADGVYATWAWIGDAVRAPRLAGVTNVGMRPTVGGTERRVECHIFDFPAPGESGEIYGQTVTLAFVQRLRAEQRFANLDELIVQIQRDITAARRVLGVDTSGNANGPLTNADKR
ncbi:MAG: bifunctional riboflavin kinase/FAD synthetase [Caldilineaceae bacterium]|nr:bifunctional riboflavin kinase/FAD synthetase [Caldilineaceae bacterium]